MADSMITLVGNLVEDPQLRAVGTGTNLSTFRIACTNRRFDRSQERWVNGPSLFMRVACWRQLAAHVCVSLRRGDRVVVIGRVRQRSYETKDGQRRVAFEIEADAVGAELTWRAVDVRRPRPTASGDVDPVTGEVRAERTGDVGADYSTGPGPGEAVPDDLSDLDDNGGDRFEDDLDDHDEPDDDDGLDGIEAEADAARADLTSAAGEAVATAAGAPSASVPFSDGVSRLGTVTE